jgi:hypothetical protein
MLLGSLLTKLESASYSGALLENLNDLVLVARIHAAGETHGEAPDEYAAGAVARFSRAASDEDWLGIMNMLERSQTPAMDCLRIMIEWSLALDEKSGIESEASCSCGGQGGCHADA